MTADEACRLPKGTRLQRVIGHSDINALAEANFRITNRRGSLLTLQRMDEIRLVKPLKARYL